MKQRCIIVIMFICLMPGVAKAQWTFDVLSVEAYINDHKKQRSILLARSTLEHSNKLLHEYTSDEVGGYKNLNVDLDKYTRAFDVIDVMYQSLRTALNARSTYSEVSQRIVDYKNLLTDFNENNLPSIKKGDVLLHGHTHVPKCVEHENYVYMNPGSVSIPKEDSWHGYMILEDSTFMWKDLDGNAKKVYEI